MKTICFYLYFLSVAARSQQSDTNAFMFPPNETREIAAIVGIHQFRNTFLELGISLVKSKYGGCAWGSYYYGHSLSMEYNPFQQTAGFSLTRWGSLANVITTGISLNTFTDFTHYNLGIKPFIGIGPGFISLTYGYNFQLINAGVPSINRHTFSLRVALPLTMLSIT